jgi:YesN/AraC family two-component response regulator
VTLTAVNGADALKIARERLIDLVLLDVEMPVMNGFETLKALRETAGLSALRIIMVTGRADANFVRAIAPLRPSGYLVKPVTAVAIKNAIDRAFAGAHQDAKSA